MYAVRTVWYKSSAVEIKHKKSLLKEVQKHEGFRELYSICITMGKDYCSYQMILILKQYVFSFVFFEG